MNAARHCPQCGTEMPARVIGGLCPACVVRFSLAETPDNVAEVAASDSATKPSPPPRLFGDYELLGELGRGGMGIVYKARQLNLHRTVAVKLIAPEQLGSPKAIERFHTEAEAAGDLDHPHIVPIYESGAHEGRHYFSMKLIEGPSLAEALAEGKTRAKETWKKPRKLPVPPAGALTRPGARTSEPRPTRFDPTQAASLLVKVADAVHYAHQRGILHRDLKPGNILLDAAGEPHVADFGLAKRVEGDSSLTLSGEVLGTPAYMAPEQAAGKAKQMTTAADIYSLGAILYELLTGRPPFRGETPMETLHMVVHEEPVAPRSLNCVVPRDVETICLKCLEKEPTRRYTSARALAEDLRHFLHGETVQARAISTPGKVWRWCRRQPALATTLVLLHLTLAAGLAGILWQWRQAQSNASTARAEALAARESLYAADINLVQQALVGDNLRQALDLLNKHIPQPGQQDLRGFEWRYLWQQCQGDELFSLPGHRDGAISVAFSPDGKMLATASKDRTVKVWDLASRRVVATLTNHAEGVAGVAFSPRGDLLATASERKVWLWERKGFRPLRSLPGAVMNARFSTDGKYLVTGASNGLMLWDARTWTVLHAADLTGLLGGNFWDPPRFGFAISADSQRVAVMSDDGVRLLSLPDFQQTALLVDSIPQIRPVAFSPDGRTLAAAAMGYAVKLWDVGTGKTIRVLSGHLDSVFGLAFSPDGSRLATCSGDQTVRLWDVASGKLLGTLRGHADEVWGVAFSPNGELLASGSRDGAVRVWDAMNLLHQAGSLVNVIPVGFDSQGDLVCDPGPWYSLTVFDPESSQPVSALSLSQGRGDSQAERWVRLFHNLSADGHTAVFRMESLATNSVAPGLQGTSRDWLALWDVGRKHFLCEFKGPDEYVSSRPSAFAEKARLLATSTTNDSVTLWQVPAHIRECVLTNAGHVEAISPDGRTLVTAGDSEDRLRMWRFDGPAPRRCGTLEIPGGWDSLEFGLEFSANGRLLATGTGSSQILVWAVPSGQAVATLIGHTRARIRVSFCPDGRTLASISDDGTVRLWHLPTGRELLKFQMPAGEIRDRGIEFSPDGRSLAATRWGEAGFLTKLWYAPSFAEIAVAARRNYRMLAHDAPSWLDVAMALEKRKRFPEALEAYAEVARRATNDPALESLRHSAMVGRARIAVAQGENYRVLAHDASTWLAVAETLEQRHRLAEAIGAYAEVLRCSTNDPVMDPLRHIAIDPLRHIALVQRVKFFIQQGRFDEAGTDNCAAFDIPPRALHTPAQCIDLSAWFNLPLGCEDLFFGSGANPTPFLDSLPRGPSSLPGTGTTQFDLRGVLQLSKEKGDQHAPPSVEGIRIGQKCARLRFLESAHFRESEGALIADYVIHYADGQEAEIPVRYGQHVRDWVLKVEPGDVSGAKVAWTGTHPDKGKIRIFEQTWDNPRPQVEITSLDFVSKMTKCAPFLIAITAEP